MATKITVAVNDAELSRRIQEAAFEAGFWWDFDGGPIVRHIEEYALFFDAERHVITCSGRDWFEGGSRDSEVRTADIFDWLKANAKPKPEVVSVAEFYADYETYEKTHGLEKAIRVGDAIAKAVCEKLNITHVTL